MATTVMTILDTSFREVVKNNAPLRLVGGHKVKARV